MAAAGWGRVEGEGSNSVYVPNSVPPSEQIQQYEDKDYEDASFIDVLAVFDALDIKIQAGKFLVPLNTLRRTPITKEELLSSSLKTKREPSSTL